MEIHGNHFNSFGFAAFVTNLKNCNTQSRSCTQLTGNRGNLLGNFVNIIIIIIIIRKKELLVRRGSFEGHFSLVEKL